MSKLIPRYPVYVPSKGRADFPKTARMFSTQNVPFHLVVEPQEVDAYHEWKDYLLVLPENNRGLVFARNWIKDHAVASGAERHWQFDDDVLWLSRLHGGRRINTQANIVLAIVEDFVDRYENVALASLNSEFFMSLYTNGTAPNGPGSYPPFYLNARCYTNFLMLNRLPNRWRFRYNEDTDMTLQVLVDGWCTLLINAFLMKTPATLKVQGGQMLEMYGGDGRLKMARQLERVWPGVVETTRRFGRPQHKVRGYWKYFDTPLRFKPGFVPMTEPNEYGMKLVAVKPVRDDRLRKYYEDHQ